MSEKWPDAILIEFKKLVVGYTGFYFVHPVVVAYNSQFGVGNLAMVPDRPDLSSNVIIIGNQHPTFTTRNLLGLIERKYPTVTNSTYILTFIFSTYRLGSIFYDRNISI